MFLPDVLMASMVNDLEADPHYDAIAHRRLAAMCCIFVLSLFAVSFPGISQKVAFLPIPRIVFFVGKHFGTGVILSTAFCHLLQDSFEALTSRTVRDEYGSAIGKQCGLIILASLLSIFTVEYISTSYVDHLHAEPSAHPSPLLGTAPEPSEATALLAPQHHYLSSLLLNSPRHSRSSGSFYLINDLHHHVSNGEYRLIGGHGGCVCVCFCDQNGPKHSTDDTQPPQIGRKRQVVGILVLQLGIMIHSLVIGLTLAITHGAEFTTLATAICFHQLFEGLSLGIRIAALPPSDTARQHWFAPTLSLLFAITTPVGMALGIRLFQSSHRAQMALTQGLMSAISAGMLIYAATVEMLAGDFVFGNLQGDHGHGHQDSAQPGPTPKRKAIALVSLLAGVTGMGLVGIGE